MERVCGRSAMCIQGTLVSQYVSVVMSYLHPYGAVMYLLSCVA